MKGSLRILLLTVAALLLIATVAPAEQLMLPVDKTVHPGFSYVTFDGTVYRICTRGNYHLTFERIDSRYIRLFIVPVLGEPQPYWNLAVQWSVFPPVVLTIDSPDGNAYDLDSETGYAEK